MTPDPNTRRWRKSSRSSGQNGECIELAHTGMVRDSIHPASPTLQIDLHNLLTCMKAGMLDR